MAAKENWWRVGAYLTLAMGGTLASCGVDTVFFMPFTGIGGTLLGVARWRDGIRTWIGTVLLVLGAIVTLIGMCSHILQL